MKGLRDIGILRLGQIRAMAVLILLLSGMAFPEEAEQEWPLSLELIWETPEKGEAVFPDGFPPPEIKAAFEDTSILVEDREWVLNNIRLWAARKTKKLWLDDGEARPLPVVSAVDRELHVFSSNNMAYWLVRTMRFEGPPIPQKPKNPASPGSANPEYWEKLNAWSIAVTSQKAHWREAFIRIDGQVFWDQGFGPYDTHLEDSYLGNVEAYVADDGQTVVKRGGFEVLNLLRHAGKLH